MLIKLKAYDVYQDQDLGSPVLVGVVSGNSGENALSKAERLYSHPTKEIVVSHNNRDITRTVSTLFVVRAPDSF